MVIIDGCQNVVLSVIQISVHDAGECAWFAGFSNQKRKQTGT